MQIITNKETFNDNYVYVEKEKELCQLIIGPDNINYYSNGVNSVDSCDIVSENMRKDHILQKYEYKKLYINFRASNKGYSLSADYFIKGNNNVYWFSGRDFSIGLDQRRCEFKSTINTRKQMEDFYNSFDSLYIVNTLGDLLYAKVNGEEKLKNKDKPILPTVKELCLQDRQVRKDKFLNRIILNPKLKTIANAKEANRVRNIEEIDYLKLFAPAIAITIESSNLLIGVKNGKFEIYWFNLFYERNKDLINFHPKYVKEGLFKLTLAPVKIEVPEYESELETGELNMQSEKQDEPTKLKKYPERK